VKPELNTDLLTIEILDEFISDCCDLLKENKEKLQHLTAG
jgi:hypothetical protein